MAGLLREAGCQARVQAQQAAAQNQAEAAEVPAAMGLGRAGRPVSSAEDRCRQASAKGLPVAVYLRKYFESCNESSLWFAIWGIRDFGLKDDPRASHETT